MLSYRHGYHAGNHADILKHLTQIVLLNKLRSKDKPFVYIDTHSGSGLYDLQANEARKTGEAERGAGRIWQQQAEPSALADYLQLLRQFNTGSRLRRYPGSPALAQALLRPQDRMIVMELHSSEIDLLRANFQHDSRIAIHHRDGFEGVVGLTPPEPRRGMVLIDPAYEVKTDYEAVLKTCEQVARRWPQGIIALWYPLLGKQKDRGAWLVERFDRKSFADTLCVELMVDEQGAEGGMYGSGMLIINTPWQTDEQLKASLPALCAMLGDGCHSRMRRLGAERTLWT